MKKPAELAWPAAILVALTVLLASMPAWLHLPLPTGGLVFDQAVLVLDDGPAETVTLPDTVRTAEPGRAVARYALRFDLPAPPDRAQTLYVPAARHQLSVTVNGRAVQTPPDSAAPTRMPKPAS